MTVLRSVLEVRSNKVHVDSVKNIPSNRPCRIFLVSYLRTSLNTMLPQSVPRNPVGQGSS